ncbi:MAG TPA: prepilin-type N-terminal cleavage/methylation domain-containing protein [Fimbriimonadaceae bacterium]|nr:prepilin-type N-terminal cleavage/methylation domain-containing protein [Fimbriimonadaceae bacterium]
MRRFRGFTLIELLVVIAIIAILAAITFPVIIRTRDGGYRSSDISNMNAVRNALQLYRVDQGGYPPAILGYATYYTSGPNVGQVIPATTVKGFLFPKRVDSLETLRPAYDKFGNTEITTAVWPNRDPRGVGSAPILDLDGDGDIDANDDLDCARQAFDRNTQVRVNPSNNASPIAEFYRISGYDVADIPAAGGTRVQELRYSLFWTSWGLGVNGCSLGNGQDDPRQLGYFDPPENTIITWNSNFRDYDNGVPRRAQREVVLFLGGSARTYDTVALHERAWRNLPR